MPFACSICEQESTRICVLCTKDTCSNHLCEKCGCCSDCCGCEVPLVEWTEPAPTYAEPIHPDPIHPVPPLAEPVHAGQPPPDPDPEPQPPHPPPDPDPLPGDEPEPPVGPISEIQRDAE